MILSAGRGYGKDKNSLIPKQLRASCDENLADEKKKL
jgi:hypothetical protein